MDWIFELPPNLRFIYWNSNPRCNGFWRWGQLGGQLGLDEVTRLHLTDGISVLIWRGGETRAVSLSIVWGHREKAVVCKPGRRISSGIKPACTSILDFSAFRTMKTTYLLFKPFNLWHFVILVWGDWYKQNILV